MIKWELLTEQKYQKINIIYKYRGVMYQNQRHVYVDPVSVDVENDGIEIDKNSSLSLGCRNSWVYTFQ
jgi:hypothetical protein